MTEIRKPAVKFMQGKRTLFLTYFCVRDFIKKDFYRVDRLDVQEATGMQRLLNTARAKSFGNDITGADKHDEAFLPTSVFLATSGNISYDENTKELYFESASHAKVCPLDVVDGQHRIEGLKLAAEKNERLMNFPISAVIATNMSEAEKMLQFVTVNTKQQPVSHGVAQHITARFTSMLDIKELPYLPPWLKKQAEKGDDAKALEIAQFFNRKDGSPWNGRIQFADEEKSQKHTINQASFIKSIKRTILAKNHPISTTASDINKRINILLNFWIAIERIFITQSETKDAGAYSVVFKTIGLDFFHLISVPVINILSREQSYTVNSMEKCLKSAGEHLPPDVVGVMSSEYWQKGNEASSINRGGVTKLASDFSEALIKANESDISV